MVELWAKDFDRGAFDNCTPQAKLYFTFRDGSNATHPVLTRLNDDHYFKGAGQNATSAEYNQGKAYRWLPASRSAGKIFTAAGDFNVDVMVWDEQFNVDFCTVGLKIIDNNAPGARIAGAVNTPVNQAVKDVDINVTMVENVNVKASAKTAANGKYVADVIGTLNYNVKPNKVDNAGNGVSTLDLVLIQRHILGVTSMTDKFKLMAADANKDGNVTASDLVELRRLILGINSTMDAWRFDPEVRTINEATGDITGQDFVAVKVGDVNGSVVLNAGNDAVEPRTAKNAILAIEDRNVVAGEVVTIPVMASDFSEIAGYQFTMNLNGATLTEVAAGSIEVNAGNIATPSAGVVTMSYNANEAVTAKKDDVLFTLTVKVSENGQLSEMIAINSSVTKAESYDANLNVGNVSLEFRTGVVAGIELFQNEPNPFRGQTTVNFMMPAAAKTTLSVFDVTGKVVAVRNIDAVKGLNSEIFTREQLGATGVLYYTLESGDFTATKKMIIVE